MYKKSYGKGVNATQSKASGLGETLERYAALYQGDEPLFLSKQSDLTVRHYDFNQLNPLSPRQYQAFAQPKLSASNKIRAVAPYDDSPIHWLPCWSLSHNEAVHLPLTSCFYNLPFNDYRFGKWNSNGCAAGNTKEEAILQGLYEVIERDAVGIWWYNQIERPSYDISLISPKNLSLLTDSLQKTHDFWVIYLTTDVGVPVMAAIGQDKRSKTILFGFGCHLQPELAAQRALTELCQMIPISQHNRDAFNPDDIALGPYLHPQKHQKAIPPLVAASSDISDDIRAIVAQLKSLGFETLALNYSRGQLPLKTTKVFVPGLCHMWPQLDNERLYQLPVKLGWLMEANTESTLNPQPLYV